MTRFDDSAIPYATPEESPRSLGRTTLGVVLILAGLGILYQYWPSSTLEQPATAAVSVERGEQPVNADSGKRFTKVKRPIADVYPGMRATAENPTDDIDLAFGTQVDSSSWKQVVLKAPKKKGSYADVWLLRPETWIASHNAVVGGKIQLSLPEVGVEGEAEVLRIEPCPEIQAGPGRVVTGRFVHHDAELVDLKIASESSSIGTTPNHPFWSEDQQAFVRADELEPGEQVRTLTGLSTVESLTKREGLHTVYNLEIQVDHVYHVGEGGVLVHNICAKRVRHIKSLMAEGLSRDEIKAVLNDNASPLLRNYQGERVIIPEGHIMSPRDPVMSAVPEFRRGPFTTTQRDDFLRGNSGGTHLSPHHRHQIPTTHGGVIDELPGPGHPTGNIHTAGSPSRHPGPSVFNSMQNGKALRASEIRDHWQAKGQRLVEVEPGVWIDPGISN
ncbi:MAG: hypothetical protein KDA65_07190 [Planctomycetaceae bacterium]|nr:hypothetical protein [Planctomycetaceae bacterium]